MLVKESEERNFTDENLEEWKKTGIIKNFQDKILDFSTLSNVDRTGWTDKLIVRDCSFKYLDISDLGLKTLEVLNCSELEELNVASNNLDNIIFENVDKLEKLYLNNNKLTSFDTINLPNIKDLDLSANQLDSLTLSNYKKLEILNCPNNQLVIIINLENCQNLKILSCQDNWFTKLKVRSLKKLETLYCFDNMIKKSLDCQGLENLKDLNCSGNVGPDNQGIRKLKLNDCKSLETLDCAETNLKRLALVNHPNLEIVSCRESRIGNLLIKDCSNLGYLDNYSIKPTKTIINNSPKLEFLYCSDNDTFFSDKEKQIKKEDLWKVHFPKLKIFDETGGGEENPAFMEWLDKRRERKEKEKLERARGNKKPDPENSKKKKNVITDPSQLTKNNYPDLLEYFGNKSEITIAGEHLTETLIIDGYQGYKINVGNNPLLRYLWVKNCPNLTTLRYAHCGLRHDAWYDPKEYNNPNLTIIDNYNWDGGIEWGNPEENQIDGQEKFNQKLSQAKKDKESQKKQQDLEEKIFKIFLEIIAETEQQANKGNWKKVEENIKIIKESPKLLLIKDEEKVKEIYERISKLEQRLFTNQTIQSQSKIRKTVIGFAFIIFLTLGILALLINKMIKKIRRGF